MRRPSAPRTKTIKPKTTHRDTQRSTKLVDRIARKRRVEAGEESTPAKKRSTFSRLDLIREGKSQLKPTSRRKSETSLDAPEKKRVSKAPRTLKSEMRLNKFIADAGICSRRSADELVESGAVKINGKTVRELGTKVHPGDLVTVHGEPVSYRKHLTYIVLNKPKDYITTTKDESGRKTVMDLIPINERLYPVGRLDRNTTGVLIITNDGDLATRLMHPSYDIEREYVVGLDTKLKPNDAKQISKGIDLEDGKTAPAELMINPQDALEIRIRLKEGKNREVRRMFEHFDYEVVRLHRSRYANITVAGLSRGEYRHLTKSEVSILKSLVGLQEEILMESAPIRRNLPTKRASAKTSAKPSAKSSDSSGKRSWDRKSDSKRVPSRRR